MSGIDFVISGMFRSGSSLLAKMLDVTRGASVAVDPYMQFFKGVYAKIYSNAGLNAEHVVLSGMYYPESSAVMAAVDCWDNIALDESDIRRIVTELSGYIEPFSPLIVPRLSEIRAGRAGCVFRQLAEIARAEYAKPGTVVFGIKDCWIEKFLYRYLDDCAGCKVVLIVRDPRAIFASKNVQVSNKAPFLFLARQWRESSAHAVALFERFGANRVHVLRYEDLVMSPEAVLRGVCTFLGIDFKASMCCPSLFRDGLDNVWKNNSSYTEQGQTISSASVDRWRTVLSEGEVALVDRLLWRDMHIFGYEVVDESVVGCEFDNFIGYEVGISHIPQWVLKAGVARHITDNLWCSVDMAKEYYREHLISASQVADDVCKGWFVDGAYRERLKSVVSWR